MTSPAKSSGFTLIELAIVLVIIGLIIGGVLVGQNLIAAAGVRATITQIEKFNTAANTFRGKYGYLPGDIKDPDASSFGFAPRGSQPGQGDGNGVLYGWDGAQGNGAIEAAGETLMFWVDLSQARLIDAGLNTASATAEITSNVTGTAIQSYFPAARIGNGNYIYVYSGGMNVNPGSGYVWQSSGINYFGLSAINTITQFSGAASTPALTVAQAFSIDQKMDDGLPQTGHVIAQYLNSDILWTDGTDAVYHPPNTGATPGSSTTCFDNGNVAGTQKYSIEIGNGANVNCALSFQFQ